MLIVIAAAFSSLRDRLFRLSTTVIAVVEAVGGILYTVRNEGRIMIRIGRKRG